MNAHDLFLLAYVLPMVLLLLIKFVAILLIKEPVRDMTSRVIWTVMDAVIPGLNIIVLLSAVLVTLRAMIHDK